MDGALVQNEVWKRTAGLLSRATGNLLRYERKVISLHIMLCHLINGPLVKNEVCVIFYEMQSLTWKGTAG